MADSITVEAFRELFETDQEFAVIDPRAPADYADGHILAASSLPLADIPERIECLVPDRLTLCVFCDSGGGEAEQAADQLAGLGYEQAVVLAGGLTAWVDSGGELFSGVSVASKAFGEWIESTCQTPSITAAELHRRQQAGDNILLLDARTEEEHVSYCIPGAQLCAGAELVYRVPPAMTEDRDIVVHCGGRTRSIIGAQTLIDAGLERVFALEDGTMAWQFEGLELETGNSTELPPPDASALTPIRAMAQQMASRWYIDRMRSIPLKTTCTRYLIDVRHREEYEAGHIAGSLHIPGGHLLQNVDRYLLVRNAMVVLIDSDRVRATTVAVWLRRMGWRRVFVFSLDDDKSDLEMGPGALPSPVEDRDLDPRDYTDVDSLLEQNRAYLDWEKALLSQINGDPAVKHFDNY